MAPHMPLEQSENSVNRDIELFLSTPLFRFRYKVGKEQKRLPENTIRLSGTVKEAGPGGFLVRVREIINMKDVERDLPFGDFFIPFSKIDFAVFKDT